MAETIELKEQTVQAIVNYLSTQPYRETVQLISLIQKEAAPQEKPPEKKDK